MPFGIGFPRHHNNEEGRINDARLRVWTDGIISRKTPRRRHYNQDNDFELIAPVVLRRRE